MEMVRFAIINNNYVKKYTFGIFFVLLNKKTLI